MKEFNELLKDAARYRFLRSAASRDNKNHTRRALKVAECDWGRSLLPKSHAINFWSQRDIEGKAMDKAVDAAMRREKRR